MRKTILKAAIAAMVIVLSSSNTVKAAEEGYYEGGFTSEISDIVWDEEPQKEEPKEEEPAPAPQPDPEPKKEEEKHEEPAPQPAPSPEPQKEEPKKEEPSQKQEQPKKEEPKNDTPAQQQQDDSSNDSSSEPAPVNNNNEQKPVVTEEKKVDEKPSVDASAVTRAVKSAPKKTVAPVKETIVDEIEAPVFEDEEPVVTKTVESNDSNMLLILLALLLFVLLLLLILLLALRRKYGIVCIKSKKDGVEEEVIKRFASFKKACEFVSDYDWHRNDAELRIINNRQRNEEVRVGGKKINKSIVYYVNNGKTIEGSDYCTDMEASVMEDVLGFNAECI